MTIRIFFSRSSTFVFLVAVLAAGSAALAQKTPKPVAIDSNFITVSNAAVEVWLNKHTGQFWVARKGGDNLLFTGEDGGTSATSVRLEGTTFTNNRLRAPEAPVGTVYMPAGRGTVVDDSVFFTTDILLHGKSVRLTQKFVPMIEGDYGFVRIYATVENTSMENVRAGMQTLFDLFLKEVDGMTVLVDGALAGTETQWSGSFVPDGYEATHPVVPWNIIARLQGNGTTPPDAFTVGNWNYAGYLGAFAWNYTPSGLPLGADNATLLQWDDEVLTPGESRTVVTDYGVKIVVSSSLACTADSLVLNFLLNGYEPDPFRVISYITNTGEIAISNMQMEIVLPPELHLASGETATRTVVGPLMQGQTTPVSWRLHADTAGVPRTVTVLTILDDGNDVDTCEVPIHIPAIPFYALETICPEDVYLELTDDELGYKNEHFTIQAGVRNVGNTLTDGATAGLTLATILRLESGTEFQYMEPGSILPGEESYATWGLRAIPQCKDTVIELRIYLQRPLFYDDTCTVRVHFPATKQGVCVPNGILTRGTSYHSVLIHNFINDGSGVQPDAVLYFMADSASHVVVTEEINGVVHEFDVDACKSKTLVLSTGTNSLVLPIYELVEKRSVTIKATYPVTVIAGSLRYRHSDATLLLPDHALGTEYLTVGYNYSASTEQFSMCATQDNTQIDMELWTSSGGSIPGRIPYQMSLNTSESFTILQGALSGPSGGFTGSYISSSAPIAVVGGSASDHIPGYTEQLDYLNPSLSQIPPVGDLGTEYVVTPYKSRLRGYTIRVVATEPSTNVLVGTTPVSLTLRGEHYETQLDDPTVISADKPILVAQYSHSASWDYPTNEYGDGSMVVIPPTDRFASCHTFPTAVGSDIGNSGLRFPLTYANLIVYAGGESQVSVNGRLLPDTLFHPIPGSVFMVATVEFLQGVQNIGTMDMRGVGVMVYAFEYHDAYSFVPAYITGSKTTGVNDVPAVKGLEINVWPNPAQDHLVASITSDKFTEGALVLYDALGRTREVVFRGGFEQGITQYNIDLSKYQTGTYFLAWQYASARKTVRFTIVR